MLHGDRTRLLSASSVPEKPMLLLSAPAQTALAPLTPGTWSPPPVSRARSGNGSAWLISLLTAMVILMGFALLAQHLSLKPDGKPGITVAEAAVAHAESIPVRLPPAPAPPVEEPPYPYAQFVEVTGVRLLMDLNHRPQVQYLVVNHSETELANIGLKIAVRPAAAPAGLDPFFTVSARVPSLGPHQSKEIRTDLDSDLRADVQVTSQQ